MRNPVLDPIEKTPNHGFMYFVFHVLYINITLSEGRIKAWNEESEEVF
jgi:hypothetical protein